MPSKKGCLIGCGSITFFLVAVIVGLGIWISAGQDEFQMSPYHPFRSVEAKEKFLESYDSAAKKWPVPSTTKLIETSYGKTYVRVSGPIDAPPLVLLHGIGGNSLQWIPNIKALSAHYCTYAVDNIYDFGRSVYTRPMHSPDDFVSWLDELFDALELGDRVNIMGLSYGGWIAAQYALRHQNRLDKMVLIAPVCTVQPLSFQWIARAVLCAIPIRYFTKSFLYWLLEDLSKSGKAGKAILEGHIDQAYLAAHSFQSKRMVNPTVLSDDELRRIRVPTLFMVGENEKIYSAKEAADRLWKVAPQIRIELIPKAGHDLTIVQTKMVNKKILEFLRK
jgi:pimeloyl-ACP methyl ester carboxylesterase